MDYGVLHSEKGTGGSGGIGKHIDREEGYEHSCLHSFPERKHLNINFPLPDNKHKMSLPDAIQYRIEKGYNGKRKIRTDAVKFNTHILSGSHEKMIEIFKDKKKSQDWINENFDFICKEFGKENIVRFTLHMDEKTPHIHAVTVPITNDGRLSSKQILGNPTTLRNRQDAYGLKMKPFGLERGERNSGIKHEDAKKYYERMSLANKSGEEIDDLSVKNKILGVSIGVDKEKTIESLKNALIHEKTSSKSKELELKSSQRKLKQAREQFEKVKEKNIINLKTMDNLCFDDKNLENYKLKRINDIQKELKYQLKNEVNNKYNLHTLKNDEIDDFISKTLIAKAKIKGISSKAYVKIAYEKEFKKELRNIFRDRAEKNQEQSLNKNRSRGRGFNS